MSDESVSPSSPGSSVSRSPPPASLPAQAETPTPADDRPLEARQSSTSPEPPPPPLPAPSAPASLIGTTIERYSVEALIGRGGMGEVYRAFDERLRRKVALKILRPDKDRPDAVARLFREARAAAALTHPNAVAIHDLGEADGLFYIVMELVSGSPLLVYVGDDRASIARKIRWLTDIARGLACAHKAGILHRDVKPSNVMVTDDDVAKVLDFGLAKPVDPQSLDFKTQAGRVVGTARYMAPEQHAGAADPRSDQYSFGVTAYELLAGRYTGQPFKEAPPLDTVVRGLDRAIAAIVARTLRPHPDDRFSSMNDVVLAFEDAARGTRGTGERSLADTVRDPSADGGDERPAAFDSTFRETGAPAPASTARQAGAPTRPATAVSPLDPMNTLLSAASPLAAAKRKAEAPVEGYVSTAPLPRIPSSPALPPPIHPPAPPVHVDTAPLPGPIPLAPPPANVARVVSAARPTPRASHSLPLVVSAIAFVAVGVFAGTYYASRRHADGAVEAPPTPVSAVVQATQPNATARPLPGSAPSASVTPPPPPLEAMPSATALPTTPLPTPLRPKTGASAWKNSHR